VTFNVSFLFVFIAFLVLGTWMLILHHVVAESERARTGPELMGGIGPRSPLFRMSLIAAAGTFALAGLMFFVIPRVGQAALPFRAELGRRISGFSERVELGAYGEIESDQTVVMRVRFPDSIEEPQRLPNLRWRGLAFDRFDGRVWEAGPRQRVLLRPAARQRAHRAPGDLPRPHRGGRGVRGPPRPSPRAGGDRGGYGRHGQRRPSRRADAPAVRRGFRARAHAAPRSPAGRVAGG